MAAGAKPKSKKPARRRHTEEEHRWIIVQFACFRREYEVVAQFETVFKRPLSSAYAQKLGRIRTACDNPALARLLRLTKYVDLFLATRLEFQRGIAQFAVASPVYRIQELDEMYAAAKKSRNYTSAARLLEQAARETGGMYRARNVGGFNSGGDDLPDETKIDIPVVDTFKADVVAKRIGETIELMRLADLRETKSGDD